MERMCGASMSRDGAALGGEACGVWTGASGGWASEGGIAAGDELLVWDPAEEGG